jgi:hypothetical protein
MPMHDDDNLDLSSDALLNTLRLVGDQVAEVIAAGKAFAASPRDGLADLEHGRPLLHDLRALASTLTTLADGLRQTADEVALLLTR